MRRLLHHYRGLMVLLCMLVAPQVIYAWNIKHEYTDKMGKTMGKNKVHREGNEVFVEEFYYTQGISGINSIDYSLDIGEFNDYLYYLCQNTDYPYIYVTIKLKSSEDKYGNKKPGDKITIGKIDIKESKKYKTINHWANQYGFLKMFYNNSSLILE